MRPFGIYYLPRRCLLPSALLCTVLSHGPRLQVGQSVVILSTTSVQLVIRRLPAVVQQSLLNRFPTVLPCTWSYQPVKLRNRSLASVPSVAAPSHTWRSKFK